MPARRKTIRKVMAGYQIQLEKPSRGSHWRFRRIGQRSYTVPAHKGMKTEVTDEYISGLCRHFGLEKAEVWEKLRGGK